LSRHSHGLPDRRGAADAVAELVEHAKH
jgi:hypothetical protein